MKKESNEKELVINFKFVGDDYSKSEPVTLSDIQKGDLLHVKLFTSDAVQKQMKQLKTAFSGKVLSIDDDKVVFECEGKPKDNDNTSTFKKTVRTSDLDSKSGTEILKVKNYKKQYLDSAYMEEIGVLRKMIDCILASLYREDGEGAIVQPKHNNFTLFNVKDNVFKVVFSIRLIDVAGKKKRKQLVNLDKLEKLLLDTYPLRDVINAKSLSIDEVDV